MSLFEPELLFDGDPLSPDTQTVTPVELVARLTRGQRETRVERLIEQAHAILSDGIAEHLDGRELVATVGLFSGGNDSTTLMHLFRGTLTHAAHANTTIGIEETRQFVRDTCAAWGVPLIERKPTHSYEDLVLGNVTTRSGQQVWAPGFPGPGAHGFMYARLKERALDLVRHDLGVANSKSKAAVFIAGRRRQESERRADVPLSERDGTVIWVSPLAMWTKLDLTTYRLMAGDVPRNPVADLLHMSGECLCGAYAKPGELEEVRYWFPDVAEQIDDLERRAYAAGIDPRYCTWGHGLSKPKEPAEKSGRLCSSCEDRFQETLDFDEVTA